VEFIHEGVFNIQEMFEILIPDNAELSCCELLCDDCSEIWHNSVLS